MLLLPRSVRLHWGFMFIPNLEFGQTEWKKTHCQYRARWQQIPAYFSCKCIVLLWHIHWSITLCQHVQTIKYFGFHRLNGESVWIYCYIYTLEPLHKDSVLLVVFHFVAVDTVSLHLKATHVIITTINLMRDVFPLSLHLNFCSPPVSMLTISCASCSFPLTQPFHHD